MTYILPWGIWRTLGVLRYVWFTWPPEVWYHIDVTLPVTSESPITKVPAPGASNTTYVWGIVYNWLTFLFFIWAVVKLVKFFHQTIHNFYRIDFYKHFCGFIISYNNFLKPFTLLQEWKTFIFFKLSQLMLE